MRKILFTILLAFPILGMSQSVGDGYSIIDDYKVTETETVSDIATMTPQYKIERRKGVKMLIAGISSMVAGAGMYYYADNYMKGYRNQRDYKLTGIALFGAGGTITICSSIPFTKARKIKNQYK